MDLGNFYFINDAYYEKFNGFGLLENRETINGQVHGRPCFYSFKELNSDIYWMIPISSKVSEYQEQYEIAIKKYDICDGISFGYILGEKKAFLIQNMCPVTAKYIANIYIDKNTLNPIEIPQKLKSELNAKIRKAVRMYRKGIKIVLSNALDIEKYLIDELAIEAIKSVKYIEPIIKPEEIEEILEQTALSDENENLQDKTS